VKVKGIWHYAWRVVSTVSRKIVAYHFSDNRSVRPAITVLLDMISNITKNLDITLVTDGNPSYMAALHFINLQFKTFTLSLVGWYSDIQGKWTIILQMAARNFVKEPLFLIILSFIFSILFLSEW